MEQIKNYEHYTLKFDGTITNKQGRVLKPYFAMDGYLRICLRKDGIQRHFSIHRLIAEHFIANPDNLEQIDHIDNNKLNNSIQNLRWITRSDNNHNSHTRKGYYYDKQNKKWRAQIKIENIRKHLGYFKTEEEARTAYEAASAKYYPGVLSSL